MSACASVYCEALCAYNLPFLSFFLFFFSSSSLHQLSASHPIVVSFGLHSFKGSVLPVSPQLFRPPPFPLSPQPKTQPLAHTLVLVPPTLSTGSSLMYELGSLSAKLVHSRRTPFDLHLSLLSYPVSLVSSIINTSIAPSSQALELPHDLFCSSSSSSSISFPRQV